jgi:F0F1-type ATP synthase beta subunit
MYGAVRLSRKGKINAASTQMFVQTSFQEEVVRGVIKQARSGGWEKNFLVCNTATLPSVDVESKGAKKLVDIWGKAVTSHEDKQLYTMTNELLVSFPYDNKIKLKVK